MLRCGIPSELAANYMLVQQAAAQTKRFLAAEWFMGNPSLPGYAKDPVIRVVRGREFEHFTEESQTLFVTRPFRITSQSDRMGYRITGEALTLKTSLETISEAVSFGTIQVPPEGNPIGTGI